MRVTTHTPSGSGFAEGLGGKAGLVKPLPLGVAGREGSTVIVGLNGLRLLADGAWRRARAGMDQ